MKPPLLALLPPFEDGIPTCFHHPPTNWERLEGKLAREMQGQQEPGASAAAMQPSPPSSQSNSKRGKASPLQRRTSAHVTASPTRNALGEVTGVAFPPRSPRATPQLVDVKEWAAGEMQGRQKKEDWAPEVLGFPSPRAGTLGAGAAAGAGGRGGGGGGGGGGGASERTTVGRDGAGAEERKGAVTGSPRAEQIHFL